jgi:hypothetical protein
MTEQEWFETVRQKAQELHRLCDEAPTKEMSLRAREVAELFDGLCHVTSFLVGGNTWEMKYLLPYDARELENKWKNNVLPRLK